MAIKLNWLEKKLIRSKVAAEVEKIDGYAPPHDMVSGLLTEALKKALTDNSGFFHRICLMKLAPFGGGFYADRELVDVDAVKEYVSANLDKLVDADGFTQVVERAVTAYIVKSKVVDRIVEGQIQSKLIKLLDNTITEGK